MQWLWERKLFNMVRQVNAFATFRKWRTYMCLKMNVRREKNDRCRQILVRRLFFANEVFQSALCHVKSLCERASSSQNDIPTPNNTTYGILMIKYDRSTCMSLEAFFKQQYVQIDWALEQLFRLKQEIMQIAYDSCIVIFKKNFFKFCLWKMCIIDCWRTWGNWFWCFLPPGNLYAWSATGENFCWE